MNRALIKLILIVFVIVLVAWYFSNIFMYLAISLVISTLLRPIVMSLRKVDFGRVRIPKTLAILISFISLSFFIGLFVLLFVPLITSQVQVLSGLEVDSVIEKILAPIQSAENFLRANSMISKAPGFLVDGMRTGVVEFIRGIDFSEIINSLISITGSFFVGLLAVTFMTFFLLYDPGLIRNPILQFVPNRYFEVFISAFRKIEKLLSNYLLGLMFQMIAIFSIAAIGLSLFGVNYALTIAVFAAFANLIPYMGPLLGGTFGIIVGLSTTGNFGFNNEAIIISLEIMTVFASLQIIDNVILQPVIFSKSVKAHPLEIFVIIFAGATIAGIPGMIMAIPAYTIIRVSVAEIYSGYNKYQVFRI